MTILRAVDGINRGVNQLGPDQKRVDRGIFMIKQPHLRIIRKALAEPLKVATAASLLKYMLERGIGFREVTPAELLAVAREIVEVKASRPDLAHLVEPAEKVIAVLQPKETPSPARDTATEKIEEFEARLRAAQEEISLARLRIAELEAQVARKPVPPQAETTEVTREYTSRIFQSEATPSKPTPPQAAETVLSKPATNDDPSRPRRGMYRIISKDPFIIEDISPWR